MPTTGYHLYLPVREIAMPEITDVSSMPSIIGTMSRPASVALEPVTICRYVGRKAIAPNIEMPVSRPPMVATLKFRLRNRASGMIGSAARRSTSTKATPDTIAPAIMPMICGDAQSYVEPAQVVVSTMQVLATAIRTMPA